MCFGAQFISSRAPPSSSSPPNSRVFSPPVDSMDLPQEVDDYIRGSIEHSFDIPVSAEILSLKLLASEEARRGLQDRVFLLEDRLHGSNLVLEKSKAEATINALGLKKCIEEKEMLCSRCADLADQCAKLEKECCLYNQDIEKLMESCDELGKENVELTARTQGSANDAALLAENESLKSEKELLRINLVRAENEAKVLFEENNILDKENKWLLGQLNKETNEGSDAKHNGGNGSNKLQGKRKSSMKCSSFETTNDEKADTTRRPLSPVHQNSPGQRRQKK